MSEMSEIEKQTEIHIVEDKLYRKYLLWSKLILFITILFIIFTVILFIGITSLGYGHNWALFSLGDWMILICVIFVIFIILELVLFFHLYLIKKKRIELVKPKPEFIEGKRVYVFTYPPGMEGGIFSKTYVDINENSVLRLRTLMISPEELWSKKEE